MKLHPENRLPVGIAGGLVVLTLIVVLIVGGESSPDQPPQVADTTSQTTGSVTFTSADPAGVPDGPRLAPLDCFALLPEEEVDKALGVEDLPWDERGASGTGKGEACVKRLVGEEGVFVGLEPGGPGDFGPGAELVGVPGEPVSGVGDEARWFGGPAAEGGGVGGILSVSQETSFGFLYFRIALGRPDLTSAAQLEVAKSFALGVLPRFPFVVVEEPEPELVTFDWDPVDLSVVGYANNLLVKEEAGEWTREEGLVATLKLFAGETDATRVLRHPDLVDYSGTGVVRLAQEYMQTGTDDEVRAEIARLLDSLFPSRQQLEQMAEGGSAPEAAGVPLFVPVVFVQEGDNPCQTAYGIDPPCMVPETSKDLEARWPGRYRVWRPIGENADDWDDARVGATVEALRKSVVDYSKLTAMPPIDIVLVVAEDMGTTTAVYYETRACEIVVFPFMQEFSEDYYKQILARDIARCLIDEAFLTASEWWAQGLAMYLGGSVYPDVNLEHDNLPNRLADWELRTSLFDRYHTNWVFFEHLHPSLGSVGILSLMSAVNAGGENALADYWHPFNEQLTDASVPDIGTKVNLVPYDPPFKDVQIKGAMEMTPHPPGFAVSRGQMTVESGKKACVSYKSTGGANTSWRGGAIKTTGGSWSTDLPSELSGVTVFLVTATEDGAQLTMTVEKVIDTDKNCEDEEDNRPEPEYLDECDFCDPTAFLDKRPPWHR